MTQAIDCNFARAAVHHYTKSKFTRNNKLPKGSISSIIQAYNQQFSGTNLTTTYTVAAKKFIPITRIISNSRWNSPEAKQTYLETFSSQSWSILNEEEKTKHTLRGCKACQIKPASALFPSTKHAVKQQISPTITIRQEDLTSPETFGARLIEESNHLTKVYYK